MLEVLVDGYMGRLCTLFNYNILLFNYVYSFQAKKEPIFDSKNCIKKLMHYNVHKCSNFFTLNVLKFIHKCLQKDQKFMDKSRFTCTPIPHMKNDHFLVRRIEFRAKFSKTKKTFFHLCHVWISAFFMSYIVIVKVIVDRERWMHGLVLTLIQGWFTKI